MCIRDSNLTAPSRYLVYMPGDPTIGVSAKIDDEEERERLKQIVREIQEEHQDGNNGYIVRTAAEGVATEAIQEDVKFLKKLWSSIELAIKDAKPGDLVFADLPLVNRTLRDLVGLSVERVRIDSRESFQSACRFCLLYTSPSPRDATLSRMPSSA